MGPQCQEVTGEITLLLMSQAGDQNLGLKIECGTWWSRDVSALLTPASSLLPSLLDPSPQHIDVLSHFSTQNKTKKISL